MLIFPAIDLYDGKAVRLYKGDYSQMTVYSENPPELAEAFRAAGATHMHLVDLEGAKTGETPNLETIRRIREAVPLFIEVGGGVRSMVIVERCLDAGIDRVILGTAAVTDPSFLRAAVSKYGEKIAVGVDIRDGKVAIRGWTEKSAFDAFDFCRELQRIGVRTIICTDVSKDGAMQGTNRALYGELSKELSLDIIASGGVSTLEDIKALRALNLCGAIIGKAYYTGAIDLREAIGAAT
ncbi:MAG: 1-(5-phosphoribosyl)-5-[(5-phosphoribosylamino)methylideneamino]imidazole-4-carboxamide isomerase [Oscillospiraceae bacterium]|nr:1-(5-phosphoribosyl)-5-[(5-phosphoribosylamino)methylideneamino]imidazole-4-carboxamide isomerase [Oscillospiraceae bacterium]